MATIARLYRYPLKGLTAELLQTVEVEPRRAFPNDRRFALALADSPFDPMHPVWMRKTHFLMLMRDDRLAQLETRYDEEAGRLEIRRGDALELEADLTGAEGRHDVEAYFEAFMAEASGGPAGRPRFVEAPGHVFTDDPVPLVSVINLGTVQALENVIGAPVDPLRFRGNIYIEGLPAFAEFDWVGKDVAIGGSPARFRGVKRIDRCAATNVDPATGMRDLNIPLALKNTYGHIDCGVFLEVKGPGRLAPGAEIGPEV